MLAELNPPSRAPAPGWRAELHASEAKRTTTHPADALITRATHWTQAWLSVVTDPRATGQQVRDARDLHMRLGVVLEQIARLALRDGAVIGRITDADVLAAVHTIIHRLKMEKGLYANREN